jgi:hypothetical protein
VRNLLVHLRQRITLHKKGSIGFENPTDSAHFLDTRLCVGGWHCQFDF